MFVSAVPIQRVGVADGSPAVLIGEMAMVMVFDVAVVDDKQLPPVMLISQVTVCPLVRPVVV